MTDTALFYAGARDGELFAARQAAGVAELERIAAVQRPRLAPPGSAPGRARRLWQRARAVPLPLLAILAVQAGLSARLIWANTAFTDEALYLWAGHLEIARLLHGTTTPAFPAYFSGAPVIYPPLGAVADAIGGLAAARALSLAFMLGATTLLWATATRLYGRRAGFLAAGLWAVAAPTVKLGAYATFDAMSMLLLAVAAWCAVRAANRDGDATGWMLAAAGAVVAANATAYSSAILDPVVVALTLLASWPKTGGRVAAMRASALAAYVIAALIGLVTLAGSGYATGVTATVLRRVAGHDPAGVILWDAAGWVGLIAVVAVGGAVVGLITEPARSRQALLVVLAGAAVLAPLEQAHIRTLTSLDKHADAGAWFAAIAAGYALSALCGLLRRRPLRVLLTATAAAALVPAAAAGAAGSVRLYSWPDSAQFVAAFRPLVTRTSGQILVEAPSPVRYYLGDQISWRRWSSTWAITLRNGGATGITHGVTNAGSPATYDRLVLSGYFGLIALNGTTTPGLDRDIISAIGFSGKYRRVGTVPYPASYYAGHYTIWERR